MEMKRVITAFILTGLLFTGNNYYYTYEVEEKKDKIEELEASQGLRDSEIARLEGVVKENKKEIKKKEEEVNSLDLKLNENLEEIEKQKEVIEDQKKLINEQKKLMETQKSESKTLRKVKEKENFNQKKKGSDVGGRKLNVEMTAYIANCSEGCTGITATGVDVRGRTTYQGHRIVATDPDVIPLHSIMKVDVNGESFTAISLDTGGAINGHIVDYLVGSTSQALDFGRQNATITILREGK